MEIQQTKGIFDKNQKLLKFINRLVIKNEFFANSYETDDSIATYDKIKALQNASYALTIKDKSDIIEYLEELIPSHFSSIEYFLTDSEVQYTDLIYSIPPGDIGSVGTFKDFLDKGLVYQRFVLTKMDIKNIILSNRKYVYYYEEGQLKRSKVEYIKEKNFEGKDTYAFSKNSTSYTTVTTAIVESEEFATIYETDVRKILPNEYPYYYRSLFFFNKNTGRLEIFKNTFDEDTTFQEQTTTELYGLPKFPYFSVKVQEATSFKILLAANFITEIRNMRDTEAFKTFEQFKDSMEGMFLYSRLPCKHFLVYIAGVEYVLTMEYIYENFYKPNLDRDIIITDEVGTPIEIDGEYANLETYPDLFLFNTVYGAIEYYPVDATEIDPVLLEDIYIRLVKNDGEYYSLSPVYSKTIFSLLELYSYLSQYFFSYPAETLGNTNNYPMLYKDINYLNITMSLSGVDYEIVYIAAYKMDSNEIYDFIMYGMAGDGSWKKIYVENSEITYIEEDKLYVIEYASDGLLYLTLNEVYYGYLLNKEDYVEIDILLVNDVAKKYNTLQYEVSEEEIERYWPTLANANIKKIEFTEDPILSLNARDYRIEMMTHYRNTVVIDKELVVSTPVTGRPFLFSLVVSEITFSNDPTIPGSYQYLVPSNIIFPIRESIFPMDSNLYYTNYRKLGVDILAGRTARDYAILRYDNTILNKEQINEFLKAYHISVEYFMKVFYNKTYELYDNYQGLVTVFIIFATLQRFLNEDSKYTQNYDLLSEQEVEILFAAYGIENIKNLPKEYLSKLLFNINTLLSKKGTDEVFLEILRIFDINDIDISRYILTKNLKKNSVENYYYMDDIQSYGHLIENKVKVATENGRLSAVLDSLTFITTLRSILRYRNYDYKSKELEFLKEEIFFYFFTDIYGKEEFDPETNQTILVPSTHTDHMDFVDFYIDIFQYLSSTEEVLENEITAKLKTQTVNTYSSNLLNYLSSLELNAIYRKYIEMSLDYMIFVREFYNNLYLSEKRKEIAYIPVEDLEEITAENSIAQLIDTYTANEFSFKYESFSKYLLSYILVEYEKMFSNTSKTYQEFFILFKEEGYPIHKLLLGVGDVSAVDYKFLHTLFIKFTLIKYSLKNIYKRNILTDIDYLAEEVAISVSSTTDSNSKVPIKVAAPLDPSKTSLSSSGFLVDGIVTIKDYVHGTNEHETPIDYTQTDGEGGGGGGGYTVPSSITDFIPSRPSITDITKRTAKISWTRYAEASTYIIEVSTDNFTSILQTIEATLYSYITLVDLISGVEYKVRYRLKDSAGVSGPFSPTATFITLIENVEEEIEPEEEEIEDSENNTSDDDTSNESLTTFSEEIANTINILNDNLENAAVEITTVAQEAEATINGKKAELLELVNNNKELFSDIVENLSSELDDALNSKKALAESERIKLSIVEEWKSYYNEISAVLDIINENYKLSLCSKIIDDLFFLHSEYLKDLNILQIKQKVTTINSSSIITEQEKSFLVNTLVQLKVSQIENLDFENMKLQYNNLAESYISAEDLNTILLTSLKLDFITTFEAALYKGNLITLGRGIVRHFKPGLLNTYDTIETAYERAEYILRTVLELAVSNDQLIDLLIQHVIESNPKDSTLYSLKFLRIPINSVKNIEEIVANTPIEEYESFSDFTNSDPTWKATEREILDRISINGLNYLTTKYYSIDHDVYAMSAADQFTRFFALMNQYDTYCNETSAVNYLTVNIGDVSSLPISIYNMMVTLQYIVFRIHGLSSITIPDSITNASFPAFKLGSPSVTINTGAACSMTGNTTYMDEVISLYDHQILINTDTIDLMAAEVNMLPYRNARDYFLTIAKDYENSATLFSKTLMAVKEYREYSRKLTVFTGTFLKGTTSDLFSTVQGYQTYDDYLGSVLPDFITWLDDGHENDLSHDSNFYKQKFITFYNYLIDAIEDKEFIKCFKNSFYYDTIKQIVVQVLQYFQSYTVTMQDIITYLRINQPLQNIAKTIDHVERTSELAVPDPLNKLPIDISYRLPNDKQYTHLVTITDELLVELEEGEAYLPISVTKEGNIILNTYKVGKWK